MCCRVAARTWSRGRRARRRARKHRGTSEGRMGGRMTYSTSWTCNEGSLRGMKEAALRQPLLVREGRGRGGQAAQQQAGLHAVTKVSLNELKKVFKICKRSSTSPCPSFSGGFALYVHVCELTTTRATPRHREKRRSVGESTPHRHHLAKAGENNAEVYAARFRSLARGRLPCRTAARAHQAHGGGSGAALLPRYITPLAPLPFPPPLS